MLNLDQLITPERIVGYWNDTNADQSRYLGAALFPPDKQIGLEINMITGRAGLPVMLKASQFDALPAYRERISLKTSKTKMPFFRERMKIDEELRQKLMMFAAAGNADLLKPYIAHIMDDTANLIKGADVVKERMVMQLLASGRIDIESSGVPLSFDYALEKPQKVTAKIPWAEADSKPLQDVDGWLKKFEVRYGVRLTRAVMSLGTFAILKSNLSIARNLYPDATTTEGLLISDSDIKQIFQLKLGVAVQEYRELYALEPGGVGHKFYPDGVVTFIVSGTLGNCIYGTTPEEMDLMTHQTNANVSIVNTGVAVVTEVISLPVNVETRVSQIVLPSFNVGGGNILIATIQ